MPQKAFRARKKWLFLLKCSDFTRLSIEFIEFSKFRTNYFCYYNSLSAPEKCECFCFFLQFGCVLSRFQH